ncbi:HlyD family secretion protein [Anaeroselena agilis]|uniref:HlyD family secretion protein n=1 Tax=Anaeroselena agilis TaxID=3063788 RepID=A0ABU3NZ81_9FIRM|nr:HlyD family secretion protein [Selenomonadales bacterium 4137-cl]
MSAPKKIANRKLIAAAAALAGVLALAGGWWWFAASGKVSTDDARIKSSIVNVSTKVPGQIEELAVREGDRVEAGQVIARIDSQALKIQVEQAEANHAAAQAKLASLEAGSRPQQVAQAQAAVAQAEASLENARRDYERTAKLYEDGALSAQQRDAALTALKVAQAQHEAARQGLSLASEGAAAQDVDYARAQVAQAAAALRNARLQLENTAIVAPVSGIVAKRPVDPGEMVSVGQTVYSITDPAESWVEANIEETNIGRIRSGEAVQFTVDAYPRRKFAGEVAEVGAATGSQFALLPADNATGNFTKVTQRIPVKIKITDSGQADLKPGMSAVVAIRAGR